MTTNCPDCGGRGTIDKNERETVSLDGWTVEQVFEIWPCERCGASGQIPTKDNSKE